MSGQGIYEQTLCWFCQRSYKPGVMCSWERRFVPVTGWEAIYNPVKTFRTYRNPGNFELVDSYMVRKCPEFLPDRKGAVNGI